jgi:hypothetical protein
MIDLDLSRPRYAAVIQATGESTARKISMNVQLDQISLLRVRMGPTVPTVSITTYATALALVCIVNVHSKTFLTSQRLLTMASCSCSLCYSQIQEMVVWILVGIPSVWLRFSPFGFPLHYSSFPIHYSLSCGHLIFYNEILWLKAGFGLVIGVIEHIRIIATSACSAVANSHTLQTTALCFRDHVHNYLPTPLTAVWRLSWTLDPQAGDHLTPTSYPSPLN